MSQPVRWFRTAEGGEIDYGYFTIDRVIRELQSGMIRAGLFRGVPDGKIGTSTMRAFVRTLAQRVDLSGTDTPDSYWNAIRAILDGRVRPGQRLPLAVWSLMASKGLHNAYEGRLMALQEHVYGPSTELVEPSYSEFPTWIISGRVVPVYRGRWVPTMDLPWSASGQAGGEDDEHAPTLSTDPSNTEEVVVPRTGTGSSIQPAKPSFLTKYQTPILVGGAVLLVGGLAYLVYTRSEMR